MTPNVQSSPRLQPVAENIYHDGAPFALLSPHKGLRNACVIYNAIKNLPEKTLIRGDFNKKSAPFIYFPERPKRKIIGASPKLAGIAGKNIETGRRELAGFINSITAAANPSSQSDHQIANAKLRLNFVSYEVENLGRDFTVGDIKEPLRKIANAHLFQNVQKLTSPHRLLPHQSSSIQDKRLREFAHMNSKMFGDLADAIRPKSSFNSKYDTAPEMAIFNIKELFKEYLKEKSNSKKTFADFIRKTGISPYIAFFAKRWLQISLPTPSVERIKLSTEPWAKELDRICPLIIKEQRRSARIVPADKKNDDNGWPLHYRQPSGDSFPPLPHISNSDSPFVAYSRLEPSSTTTSSALNVNRVQPQTQPHPQPQTQFSPLSPDTPDDELALRRLVYPSGSLPKFDLNIPYSSLDDRTSSQLSFGIAGSPQTVPGQLIAASAHELPAVPDQKPASSLEKIRVTARLVNNDVQLFDPIVDSSVDSSVDASFESSFKPDSEISADQSENDLSVANLPKFPVVPPTAFSSVALPTADSQLLLSPERLGSASFTSSTQLDEENNNVSNNVSNIVSDISSTIEDQ